MPNRLSRAEVLRLSTTHSNRLLALRGLFKDSPFDPAGVVFPVQRVALEPGSHFLAIELVVHPVERERLDLRAHGHMKIGILIPSIGVKEEFADAMVGSGRQ